MKLLKAHTMFFPILAALVSYMMIVASISAHAESHTLGLLGMTQTHNRNIWGPELNYTYEKIGIFYKVTAFEQEKGKTSFDIGAGYREEIADGFYLGGMAGFLFTKIEKPNGSIGDFGLTHFLPLGYSVGLLPWVTLEKQIPIDDEWAVSVQGYVNHLAAHISIGFRYGLKGY